MALKATIFKAELHIADMDRHYYYSHSLTLARHPSESDARMMVRLLAFALNAQEGLQFTKGLSEDDEPELWQRSLSDEIGLWVDLGQPDEKRVRKACARAEKVSIYTYQQRSAQVWWEQNRAKLQRFSNLEVVSVADESVAALTRFTARTMRLQCNIQDGQIWVGDDSGMVDVALTSWKAAK